MKCWIAFLGLSQSNNLSHPYILSWQFWAENVWESWRVDQIYLHSAESTRRRLLAYWRSSGKVTFTWHWNHSIFLLWVITHETDEQGWILTFVRGFTICSCAGYFLANPKWHLPAKLPRIHAITPLPYKLLDGYCVHTAPVKFIFQKFWRSWCSHCDG